MEELKPGDVFEKEGVMLVVHKIKDGQVYYQKWPKGVKEQGQLDNCGRIKTEEFIEECIEYKHLNKE